MESFKNFILLKFAEYIDNLDIQTIENDFSDNHEWETSIRRGCIVSKKELRINQTVVYPIYVQYCEENKVPFTKKHEFLKAFRTKFGETKKSQGERLYTIKSFKNDTNSPVANPVEELLVSYPKSNEDWEYLYKLHYKVPDCNFTLFEPVAQIEHLKKCIAEFDIADMCHGYMDRQSDLVWVQVLDDGRYPPVECHFGFVDLHRVYRHFCKTIQHTYQLYGLYPLFQIFLKLFNSKYGEPQLNQDELVHVIYFTYKSS